MSRKFSARTGTFTVPRPRRGRTGWSAASRYAPPSRRGRRGVLAAAVALVALALTASVILWASQGALTSSVAQGGGGAPVGVPLGAQLVVQAPTATATRVVLPDSVLAELTRIGLSGHAVAVTTITGDGTSSTRTVDLTPRESDSPTAAPLVLAGRAQAREQALIGGLVSALNRRPAANVTGRAFYAGLLRTRITPGVPLYLIASPLDTTNPDNWSVMAYDDDPARVVAAVNATGDVPDLSAATSVTFVSLGQAGAQPVERRPQALYSQGVWAALLRNAKARRLTFVPAPDASPVPGAPTTALVAQPPLPGTPIPITPGAPRSGKGFACNIPTGTYFAPNSATLLDATATRNALTNCIAKAGPNPVVTIDAWTMFPDPGDTLSTARAKAIAGVLVTAGITPIRVSGHGADQQPYPLGDPRNRTCKVTFLPASPQ